MRFGSQLIDFLPFFGRIPLENRRISIDLVELNRKKLHYLT
jgi:hypothetical protein